MTKNTQKQPITTDDSPGADPISGHHVMMGGKAGRANLVTLTRKQRVDQVVQMMKDVKAAQITQDGDNIKIVGPVSDAIIKKLTDAGFNITSNHTLA